jgi:hypothetical protein
MHRCLAILSLCTLAAQAEPTSARQAAAAVPKLQQKFIARLSGKDGRPVPAVWTILAHDAKAETGLREYTVTAGTVVATRGISDLVDKLTAAEVIGLASLKLDSPQLAELAFAYGDANGVPIAALDYDLRKEGEDAAPLWRITARDAKGAPFGELVVAAHTGVVISHEGFRLAPTPPDLQGAIASAPPKSATRRAAVEEKEKPGVHRRIGGKLQKFFTGKDTISK